jgi:UDP-glucose 4-epimerase
VVGIFAHAKRKGDVLKITGDGTQERDFVHVYDVARANYMGMLYEGDSAPFNVGTGKCYTINDIAKRFGGRTEYIPARLGEARVTWADITQAQTRLGWNPQLSLDDAIARGIT